MEDRCYLRFQLHAELEPCIYNEKYKTTIVVDVLTIIYFTAKLTRVLRISDIVRQLVIPEF